MERPILFSAPMIRAILAERKTQTRRVAKLTGAGRVKEAGSPRNWHLEDPDAVKACPYGTPGDRLWVRETFCDTGCKRAVYRASTQLEKWKYRKWRPSIFMPRWASRITLEIVSVGVERLQAISEADAQAEGVDQVVECAGSYTYAFAQLWDSINKKRGFGWKINPWVWVLRFKKL